MNSFEQLVLLLFVIVIYLVVGQRLPPEMVAGAVALWFVILFIGADNMDTCGGINLFKRFGIHKHRSGCEDGSYSYKSDVPALSDTDNLYAPPQIAENAPAKSEEARNDDLPIQVDEHAPDINQIDKFKLMPDDDKIDNFKLKPDSMRPKPLEYSENNYKQNLFSELGSLGDNKLASRMKFLSNMNRVAIDNRARFDKYTNLNYLKEELDDHSNSVWWDDDVALERQF